MSADTDRQEDATDEAVQEAAWRLSRFLELGYSAPDAAQLADAGADWHRARDMITAGCPRGLTARILL